MRRPRLTALSTSNEDDQTDGEVFRTGESDATSVGPVVAGVFAVFLAVASVMGLIELAHTGLGGPSFTPIRDSRGSAWGLHGIAALVMSLVCLALAFGLGFAAVALIRSRRNSCITVSAEGIVRQDWLRRRTMIPWDRVKRLVVTDNDAGRLLTVQYVDQFGRLRTAKLYWGPGPWDIQLLKEAIMRRKPFPSRRRIEKWYGFLEFYE